MYHHELLTAHNSPSFSASTNGCTPPRHLGGALGGFLLSEAQPFRPGNPLTMGPFIPYQITSLNHPLTMGLMNSFMMAWIVEGILVHSGVLEDNFIDMGGC